MKNLKISIVLALAAWATLIPEVWAAPPRAGRPPAEAMTGRSDRKPTITSGQDIEYRLGGGAPVRWEPPGSRADLPIGRALSCALRCYFQSPASWNAAQWKGCQNVGESISSSCAAWRASSFGLPARR